MPANYSDTFCNNGLLFKDDKLYLFDRHSVTVMRGWPAPLAWRRTRHKDWHCMRPEIRLVPGRDTNADRKAEVHALDGPGEPLERFMASVPAPIINALAIFPERQWHLFSMFCRVPATLELASINPALAFCLASSWVFKDRPVREHMRAVRRIVRRPQKRILQWLDWPASNMAARILAKVTADACDIGSLLDLRCVLKSPESAKLLSHLKIINGDVITMLSDGNDRSLLTPALLEQVATLPEGRPWSPRHVDVRPCTIFRIVAMTQQRLVAEGHRSRHLPRIRSLAQLESLFNEFQDRHDDLLNDQHDAQSGMDLPQMLLPPPIEGDSHIVPIRTIEALRAEAASQRNCAARFARAVHRGNVFLYSVLQPERATLAIRYRHGRWEPDQIKSANNQPVASDTVAAVEGWLTRSRCLRHGSPASASPPDDPIPF